MVVRIEECAERDLLDGYWFYEDQEPGVGEYFLTQIREEILELAACGGVHRKRHGLHFCPSKRFPHGFLLSNRKRDCESVRRSRLPTQPDLDSPSA